MRGLLASVTAVLLIAAGCSSSSKSSSSGATSGPAGSAASTSGKTYTVGLLSDLTGAASISNRFVQTAVQAGINVAAKEGYKIKYIAADTGSTPTGALTAAQTLVEVDHVFAVIALSAFTYNVAPFLMSKGIPVLGAAVDSDEWSKDPNMFSVFGNPNYNLVTTELGQAFKALGATNLGLLAVSVPSAQSWVLATAIVAPTLGMKVGYEDANFPLASTNVGPQVLKMKNAGVDGVTTLMSQNTGFAILQGLEQAGVKFVGINFAGYGSDLTDAGPGAEQIAQGQYFTQAYEPVEMNDAASQKFLNALKSAGSNLEPDLAEYDGYLSIDALVIGLKKAGSNPTQASFIQAMLGVTNYNAAGLYGSHTLSFAMKDRGVGGLGADNCYWFEQYQGTTFHLVKGLDPVCGKVVPGKA